jgi:hypothetical protein
MPRASMKQAQAAFERFCDSQGLTIADPSWGIRDARRLGALSLDYNPTYGGVAVDRYVTDSSGAYTAVSRVVERMPLGAFTDAMNAAARIARLR